MEGEIFGSPRHLLRGTKFLGRVTRKVAKLGKKKTKDKTEVQVAGRGR